MQTKQRVLDALKSTVYVFQSKYSNHRYTIFGKYEDKILAIKDYKYASYILLNSRCLNFNYLIKKEFYNSKKHQIISKSDINLYV